MEKDIEELKQGLKSKLDTSYFDEEIENLKNLINSLATSGDGKQIAPIIQSGPSISTKELNEIREAMKLVSAHEDKLKNLNLEQLLKRLSALEKDMKEKASSKDITRLDDTKADKSDLEKLRSLLQDQIDKLTASVGKLQSDLKQLSNDFKVFSS